MTQRTLIATVAAVAAAGCLLSVAQEPSQEPPGGAAAGPAGGRGGRGRGGGGGRSPDGFSQFIRPLAPQDVLIRGKSLYQANCAGCHASDMRGVPGKGNNLLRSAVSMDDAHGELIGANLTKHNPPVNRPKPM